MTTEINKNFIYFGMTFFENFYFTLLSPRIEFYFSTSKRPHPNIFRTHRSIIGGCIQVVFITVTDSCKKNIDFKAVTWHFIQFFINFIFFFNKFLLFF